MGERIKNGTLKADKDVEAAMTRIINAFPNIERVAKAVDFTGLKAAATSHNGSITKVNTTSTRLHTERMELRANRKAAKKYIKKTRALVMGTYGDDSEEFAMVGGTRMSQRKKAVREKKPAKTTPASNAAPASPANGAAPAGTTTPSK